VNCFCENVLLLKIPKSNRMAKNLLMQTRDFLFLYPWFKTLVFPVLLLYFILRPMLKFIFPKNRTTEKVQISDASKFPAHTAEEFLKQHLRTTTARHRRRDASDAPSLALPTNASRLAPIGSQISPRASEALRLRLKVTDTSVVTIAVPSDYVGSDDLHSLLRSLAGQVHVFLLVRLRGSGESIKDSPVAAGAGAGTGASTAVDKGSADNSASEESQRVRYALQHLTAGDAPVLPPHRLLWSTSVAGRKSAIRQLRSTIHVDFDRDVCRTMEQHVRSIIFFDILRRGADVDAGGASATTAVADRARDRESGASPGASPAGPVVGPGRVRGFSEDGLIMVDSFVQLLSLQL
jgi:hypothetical protein